MSNAAAQSNPNLNLTTVPTMITSEPAHLLYLEKRGKFMEQAPKAWQEFWGIAGGKLDMTQMESMTGLSWVDPSKTGDDAMVYQAGVMLKSKPATVLPGLAYREVAAGKYAEFILTGSYQQLAQAYPAAFAILESSKQAVRNDFCIEKYLNNPMIAAEADLKTAILIPVA